MQVSLMHALPIPIILMLDDQLCRKRLWEHGWGSEYAVGGCLVCVSPKAVTAFLSLPPSPFLLPPQTLVLELEIQGQVIYLRGTQGERENKD